MTAKKSRKKFIPSTLEDRIEFLREAMRAVTESHGAPCMCRLCEALVFETMAKDGEINLKTGERNPPWEDK